jgi:hypothetical protein
MTACRILKLKNKRTLQLELKSVSRKNAFYSSEFFVNVNAVSKKSGNNSFLSLNWGSDTK